MTKEELRGCLQQQGVNLHPRELEVLFLRLGLDQDGKFRSQEEVGQLMYVPTERVRQVEYKVLRRSTSLRRVKKIKDFYE